MTFWALKGVLLQDDRAVTGQLYSDFSPAKCPAFWDPCDEEHRITLEQSMVMDKITRSSNCKGSDTFGLRRGSISQCTRTEADRFRNTPNHIHVFDSCKYFCFGHEHVAGCWDSIALTIQALWIVTEWQSSGQAIRSFWKRCRKGPLVSPACQYKFSESAYMALSSMLQSSKKEHHAWGCAPPLNFCFQLDDGLVELHKTGEIGRM